MCRYTECARDSSQIPTENPPKGEGHRITFVRAFPKNSIVWMITGIWLEGTMCIHTCHEPTKALLPNTSTRFRKLAKTLPKPDSVSLSRMRKLWHRTVLIHIETQSMGCRKEISEILFSIFRECFRKKVNLGPQPIQNTSRYAETVHGMAPCTAEIID